MYFGLIPVKDINYSLTSELIIETQNLNYSRVKELLDDPECDVNCPRYAIDCNSCKYCMMLPLNAALLSMDTEMINLYLECNRVDILTSLGSDSQLSAYWKSYYNCFCFDCDHELKGYWHGFEQESLCYERIKREVIRKHGDLKRLPFYTVRLDGNPFFDALEFMEDINSKNQECFTILNWAVQNASFNLSQVVPKLLDRGADPKIPSPNGKPILVAIIENSRDFYRYRWIINLINRGLDPLETDENGDSAISKDVRLLYDFPSSLCKVFRSPEVLKHYLLNPKITDYYGLEKYMTTWSLTFRQLFIEIAPEIVKQRFLSTPIDEIQPGLEVLLEKILENKVLLDQQNRVKLLFLIIRKFPSISKETIIENLKVPPEYIQTHKNVLLHECIAYNNLPLIEMLLFELKADPNCIIDGVHPFNYKISYSAHELLIRAGGDIKFDDNWKMYKQKYLSNLNRDSLAELLHTEPFKFSKPQASKCKILLLLGGLIGHVSSFFDEDELRDLAPIKLDEDGNTFLHNLYMKKRKISWYEDCFDNSKAFPEIFMSLENNNALTPFQVTVLKSDSNPECILILRVLFKHLTLNYPINVMEKCALYLKQNASTSVFTQLSPYLLAAAVQYQSLELCRFLVEELSVDVNCTKCVSPEFLRDKIFYEMTEEIAIYLLKKGFNCRMSILSCALRGNWQRCLRICAKTESKSKYISLTALIKYWITRRTAYNWLPDSVMDFFNLPNVRPLLSIECLSVALFAVELSVDQTKELLDLGADPCYLFEARQSDLLKSLESMSYDLFDHTYFAKISLDRWGLFKSHGLTITHLSRDLIYLKRLRHFDYDFCLSLLHIFATGGPIIYSFSEISTLSTLGSTEMCGICHDEYVLTDNIYLFPCKHFFHAECAEQVMNTHHKCPYCCAPLPAAKVEGLKMD